MSMNSCDVGTGAISFHEVFILSRNGVQPAQGIPQHSLLSSSKKRRGASLRNFGGGGSHLSARDSILAALSRKRPHGVSFALFDEVDFMISARMCMPNLTC